MIGAGSSGTLCNCAALRAAPFTANLLEPLQQNAALDRIPYFMRMPEYQEPLHPIRCDALTPLDRHLWRFRVVCLEATNLARGYRRTPDVSRTINGDLLFSLANQSLMIVCKFLEVWDSFGKLSRTDDRIVPMRICAQPIIDRIRIWKDLDVFRDSVLAHTYETTDGKLISPQYILREMRVPSAHVEIMLLLDLVNYAVTVVLSAFEPEYLQLREMFLDIPPLQPTESIGITLGTEISPAAVSVLDAVNAKIRESGKRLSNEILREIREAAGS